jgi:hypothetical protein
MKRLNVVLVNFVQSVFTSNAENDFVILPGHICAFHREPRLARANCRIGSATMTTSVVVVFAAKFGLGKIPFVRMS